MTRRSDIVYGRHGGRFAAWVPMPAPPETPQDVGQAPEPDRGDDVEQLNLFALEVTDEQ